jgi:hypothetical protein
MVWDLYQGTKAYLPESFVALANQDINKVVTPGLDIRGYIEK